VRNTALPAVVCCILAGCRPCGIDSAVKLADALKNEGIGWETTGAVEPARKPPRGVKEAIALQGDRLLLEIYRVEDEKLFKMAAVAVGLRRGVESGKSEGALVDALARRPFIIAVILEPEPGSVRRAFGRLFPNRSGPDSG